MKHKQNKFLIKSAIQCALNPDFKIETHYKGKTGYYDVKILSPNGKYKSWFKISSDLMNREGGKLYDYIVEMVKASFSGFAMEIYY